MSDNIQVAIRVRPLIQRERDQSAAIQWLVEDQCVAPADKKTGSSYQFDHVFGSDKTTLDVYNSVALPIINAAMLGFNGTIFAYGQTASGKTHTMMGNETNKGIIALAVDQIFNAIETTINREFLLRVSFMEVYNEKITDLLGDTKKSLDVREDKVGRVFVHGLLEKLVNGADQVFNAMKRGEENRHYGSTNMNEKSSRSHTIFQIIIESRERQDVNKSMDDDGAVCVSHLNLVDLAGSEKAKSTGAEGQRLKEGGFINKSLFTLGQVISQLSEGAGFVNFRDAKLTRILQNALGGNSRTAIICNMTPASIEESHSTLRFACSAKRIKNKAIKNEVLDDAAMLKRYKNEIAELKKKISSLQNEEQLKSQDGELQLQLAMKEKERSEQEEIIKNLTKLIIVSSKVASEDEEFKAKRKRRETWCPGKASQGAPILPRFDAAAMDLELPTLPVKQMFFPGEPGALNSSTLPAFDETEEKTEVTEEIFVKPMCIKKRRGVRWSDGSVVETGTKRPATPPGSAVTDAVCQTDDVNKEADRLSVMQAQLEEAMDVSEKVIFEKECLENVMEEIKANNNKLILDNEKLRDELEHKEEELAELAEFTRLETDFRNQSLIEKQERASKNKEEEDLRKTAADAQMLMQDAKKQLADQRSQNQAMEWEKEEMLKHQQELEKEMTQKITRLQQELESVNAEREQLKADIMETVSSSIEAQDELRNVQTDLRASENANKELKKTIDTLEERLSQSQAPTKSEDGDLSQTNHLLQEQHDQVRLDLQIAEEVITKLKAEINELHTVKEQVSEDKSGESGAEVQNEALLARITALETEVEQCNLDLMRSQEEAAMLRETLTEATTSPESEDGALSNTNRLLQEQHDQVKVDLQIAQEVIIKLKVEIEELHTVKEQASEDESGESGAEVQNEALLARITALETEVEQRNLDLMRSQEEAAMLRETLTEATAGLESEDGEQSKTNRLLQEQHDQVRLDLQIAQGVITNLKAEINELHTVKEQESEDKSGESGAEVQNEALLARITALETEVEQRNLDLMRSQEEAAMLRETLTKATASPEVSSEKVTSDENSSEAELLSRIKALEAESVTHKEDLARAQEEAAMLRETLAEATSSQEDSEKDWSSKFEALQVEMEKVRAESAEYKDQLSQSQQEFEERQNLTKENENLKISLADAMLNRDVAQETIAKLENEIKAATEGIKSESALEREVKELLKKNEDLMNKYESLSAKTNQTRDKLLSETNRDLDLQRRLDEQEKQRKDALFNFSQTCKENQELIDGLQKQVYELQCKLQKATSEEELARHKLQKAHGEHEALKKELHDLENLHAQHEAARGRQELDPERMKQRINQLMFNVDLTNQKCQKAEAKVKELEVAARRNENAQFERDNLQTQLRETRHQMDQQQEQIRMLQARYCTAQSQIAAVQVHADSLSNQLAKASSYKETSNKQQQEWTEEKQALLRSKDALMSELNQEKAQLKKAARQMEEMESKYQEELQNLSDTRQGELETIQSSHKATLNKINQEMQLLQTNHQKELATTLHQHEEALTNLRLSNEDEMSKLKHSNEAEISDIQRSHQMAEESLRKQHEESVNVLKEENETLTILVQDYETELADSKEQLKEELTSLADQKEAELQQMKERLEEVTTRSEGDMNGRIEALRQSHEEDVKRLMCEHAEELAKIVQRHQDSLTTDQSQQAQQIQQMRQDHQNEVEQMQEEVKRLTEVVDERDAKISASDEDHRSEVENLEAEVKRLTEVIDERDAQIGTGDQDHCNEVEKLEAEVKRLTEVIDEKDTQISAVDQDHRNEVENLEAEVKRLAEVIDEKDAQIGAGDQDNRNEVENLEAEVKRLAEVIDERDTQISACDRERLEQDRMHTEVTEQLQQEHQREMDELRELHSNEIAKVTDTLGEGSKVDQDLIIRMQAEHEEEVAQIQEQNIQDILKLKKLIDEDKAEQESKHQEALTTMASEHRDAVTSMQARQDEMLVKVQEEHEQEVAALHEQVTEVKKGHQDEVTALQRQASDTAEAHQSEVTRLQQVIEAMTAECEQSSEVENLRQQHQADISKMLSEHETQIADLQSAHNETLVNLHAKLEDENQAVLAELTKTHQEEKQTLNDKLEALESKLSEQAGLEDLGQQHTEALAELQQAHDEAIINLHSRHEEETEAMLTQMQRSHQDELRKVTTRFEQDLNERQESSDQKTAEIEELQQSIVDLRDKLRETSAAQHSDKAQLQKTLDEVQKLLEDAQREKQEADERHTDSVTEYTTEIQQLKETVEKLRSDSEQNTTAPSTAEADLENKLAYVTKIKASLQREHQKIVQQLDEADEELNLKDAQIKEMAEKHETQISALNETIEKLRNDSGQNATAPSAVVADLEKKLAYNTKIKASLQREHQKKVKELEEADEELEQKDAQLKEMADKHALQISTLNDRIQYLESHQQTEAIKEEMVALRCKNSKLENDLVMTTMNMKKELQSYKQEADSYHQKWLADRNELRRLKNNTPEDSILQVSVLQPPASAASAGGSIVSNMAVFALEAEKNYLQAECQKQKNQAEQTRKDNEALSTKYKALKTQFMEIQQKYAKLKQYSTRLQEEKTPFSLGGNVMEEPNTMESLARKVNLFETESKTPDEENDPDGCAQQ